MKVGDHVLVARKDAYLEYKVLIIVGEYFKAEDVRARLNGRQPDAYDVVWFHVNDVKEVINEGGGKETGNSGAVQRGDGVVNRFGVGSCGKDPDAT